VLVDTHCHLDFESFDGDRDEVVARAAAAGVGQIVAPAIDLPSSRRVVTLAERYAGVFAAVGVHPNSSAGWADEWLDELATLASHPKVVAIGEIGLDYYRDHSPHPVQHVAFVGQLGLAARLGKPVIIHNREADGELLRLLAQSALVGKERAGVLHSFSGSWATAEAALAMAFYLGFTGPVTYKKAEVTRDVARRTPLERLLVETDAPFLAPQSRRGRRNEPAFVVEVAEKIAGLHGLEPAELFRRTSDNAARLFGLDTAARG
jgi:TatD DNase family protein